MMVSSLAVTIPLRCRRGNLPPPPCAQFGQGVCGVHHWPTRRKRVPRRAKCNHVINAFLTLLPLLSGEAPKPVWRRFFTLENPMAAQQIPSGDPGLSLGVARDRRARPLPAWPKSAEWSGNSRRNGPVRFQFPRISRERARGPAHERGCPPYPRARPRGGRDARASRRRHLRRCDLWGRRLQPDDSRRLPVPG